MDELPGRWRKLNLIELRGLYFPPNIIKESNKRR